MSSSQLMEKPALKPLSSFLSNVLRNGTLTLEQVVALNALPTPHLQFEAVMRLRRAPAQEQSACKPSDSPVKAKLCMSNKRWIEITALSLAIPVVLGAWDHRASIETSLSALMSSGITITHASRQIPPMNPITLAVAPIQNPVFVARKAAPKSAHETLTAMTDQPERTHIAETHVADVSVPTSALEHTFDPASLINQSPEAAETAAAETAAADQAAAEAMPITSRR